MPLGRTHDRITWWTTPAVGGVVLGLGGEVLTALSVTGAYLFSGLMFGGDLDIHSVQYRRWGPLRWIWLPYRRLVTHRSLLSHGPILGTLGRLIYLGVIGTLFAVLALIVGRALGVEVAWERYWQQVWRWLSDRWLVVAWTLVGLELGAMSHSISDVVGSAWKRLRNPRPRRHLRGQR